jgi:AraC-like DNA-binding protein
MSNSLQYSEQRWALVDGEGPIDSDKRVMKALELLKESSLDAQLHFSDIASSVHISGSHLRHLIKREIGMSARQYVKMVRLKRARELLESSFLSVKEVMSSVGMSDISHFVREYKSVFGCTPSQSRALAIGRSEHSGTRNSSQ